ncbi:uncharacterized protein PV07_12089 [Cladophialophora immunda]|uniref:Zn(2)-C6 fungal-type domain-containing protein n=1 Tax=Cladophialophora immunda TaxID=569365 RepID=A0A0D2BXV3_9EURO|nr:uncharacterized protein PV07_12089 [Cladophialophora immunda]KIW23928.1 hypothetical protein PV07_12089 [Cladophialophora immunda]
MEPQPSAPRRGRPPKSARNDCHTCVARRWKCDRASPRCGNCEKSGNTCGGFAVQLSWQPGFSLQKKPVKRQIARRSRWRGYDGASGPRQLEFISEHLVESSQEYGETRVRQALRRLSQATSRPQQSPSSNDKPTASNSRLPEVGMPGSESNMMNARADPGAEAIYMYREDTSMAEPYDLGEEGAEETYLDNEIPIVAAPLDLDELTSFNTTILPSYPNSPINEPEFHLDPNHVENQSQVGIPSDLVFDCESTVDELADCQDGFETVTGLELYDSHRPFAAASKDIRTLSYHFLQTIPPRPLYTGQFEWLEPIFERYNNEFCLIPLTLDMPANPFRSRMNALQKSGYLLHAVLALACHHTDHSSLSSSGRHQLSETVLNHGQIALQLFRQALNNDNVNQIAASLLDTIITLFSLDEAYSLLGSWTTHLTGAYNVVQLSGGVEAWTRNPRAAVQVALLTWWDAVLSLVNRTPCIFPYEYFESVLACADDRFFTYFGLCGCPRSLVVPLVQLAHLAEEKQKSSSMRWVSFDDSLVLEIEQSLETWSHNPSDTAFDDEENVHKDMDQIHCSEAWRNGLLLYIYRVFRWKPGDRTPGRVIHRARTILDHACACRDDQFVARQALLPLFFAGCEMHDPDARNTIRELCSAWHDRTGYYMFGGMIPLLEEVWTAQATHGPEQVWWGQVVDEKSRKESQNSLQVRICFG